MQEALHCAERCARGSARRVAAALGARHRRLPGVSRPGRRVARCHRSHGRAPAGRGRGCNRRALRALRGSRQRPVLRRRARPATAGSRRCVRTHAAAAAQAQTALRYRPPADSFFLQQDPVARIAALPGLLAIDIGPRAPWPPLDELDPFSCNLVITALLAASPADAAAALGDELAALRRRSSRRRARLRSAAGHPLRSEPRAARSSAATARRRRANARAAAASPRRARRRERVAPHRQDARRPTPWPPTAAAARRQKAARDASRQAIEAVARGSARPRTRSRARRGPPPGGRTQTLRVDADRIDALVRLTGELTVAKNAIGHAVKLAESEGSALAVTLKNRHAGLDRLVGELQRAVLGMRVLPLRAAFQRFPAAGTRDGRRAAASPRRWRSRAKTPRPTRRSSRSSSSRSCTCCATRWTTVSRMRRRAPPPASRPSRRSTCARSARASTC